jgi:uncharacterized membrane protein
MSCRAGRFHRGSMAISVQPVQKLLLRKNISQGGAGRLEISHLLPIKSQSLCSTFDSVSKSKALTTMKSSSITRRTRMETNPYEYERNSAWMPQQNEGYADQKSRQSMQRPSVRQGQALASQGAGMARKPKPMPKARALELARSMKRWLVVASFVGFGALSGLAAYHQVGTTATASSTGQTSQTTGSSSSSNGFLRQQGENNVESGESDNSGQSSSSSSSSQGSSSASSSSTASQPVSGTRTS